MKKTFRQFQPGTAEYVVHHARYMAWRGKNPSQSFLSERNSRKALASAETFMEIKKQQASVGSIMGSIGKAILAAPDKPSYDEMSKDVITASLRHIVSISTSEKEVRERIKTQLGCPYEPSISVLSSLSRLVQARELCLAMGGLVLKTGELIQIMLFGPGGEIIQV